MSGKAGHPAYFDPQDQKAYMKQPAVFANKKELIAKGLKRAPRYVMWLLFSRLYYLLATYAPGSRCIDGGEGICRRIQQARPACA